LRRVGDLVEMVADGSVLPLRVRGLDLLQVGRGRRLPSGVAPVRLGQVGRQHECRIPLEALDAGYGLRP